MKLPACHHDKLQLAENTHDPAILAVLSGDESSDVRRTVARHGELAFELLVTLFHDKDSSVSSTALSSLAKVATNESQQAEYQAILRDIALDTDSDVSSLREVIYNSTDQAVLTALYLRCEDSHIRAGIVRHILTPEILDAEIADIIHRKAGERRVENILCNPSLTKEQLLPLLKVRRLNPIEIICKVESAEALLGVAKICNPTTIMRNHCVIADLSADELEILLAIDGRYQSIVRDQLHKLGTERCRALSRHYDMMGRWLPIAV